MSGPTYFFLQTEDGSPSLRFHAEPVDAEGRKSESMHSLRGAFSETAYIYGTAIETTLEHGLAPNFFSLGLGLGYNELLTTALVMKHGASRTDVYGESFEAVAELNELFARWLNGLQIRDDFQNAYSYILNACAAHTGVDAGAIRSQLAAWLERGQWRLRSALDPHTEFTQTFSCFLFDAFSSKTTPDLWGEEFLTKLFAQLARPQAVLSTYACTGSLKRSLKTNGFELKIREGFASQRDSTFALKGFVDV